MKITKKQLRQIIREELSRVDESPIVTGQDSKGNDYLGSPIEAVHVTTSDGRGGFAKRYLAAPRAGKVESTFVSRGNLVKQGNILLDMDGDSVISPVEGKVEAILVDLGQDVKEGEYLVELRGTRVSRPLQGTYHPPE